MQVSVLPSELRSLPPGYGYLVRVSGDATGRKFTTNDPLLRFVTHGNLEVLADMVGEGQNNPILCTVIPKNQEFALGTTDLSEMLEAVGLGTKTAAIQTQDLTLYVEHNAASLAFVMTDVVDETFLANPDLSEDIDISAVLPTISWSPTAEDTVEVLASAVDSAYATCAYDVDYIVLFTDFRYYSIHTDDMGVVRTYDETRKVLIVVDRATSQASAAFTDIVPPEMPTALHSDGTTIYALGVEGAAGEAQAVKMYTLTDLDVVSGVYLAGDLPAITLASAADAAFRIGIPFGNLGVYANGPDIYVYMVDLSIPEVTYLAEAYSYTGASLVRVAVTQDSEGISYLVYTELDTGAVSEMSSADLATWSAPQERFAAADGGSILHVSGPSTLYVEHLSNWVFRARNLDAMVENEVRFDPTTGEFEFERPIEDPSRPAYRVTSPLVIASATGFYPGYAPAGVFDGVLAAQTAALRIQLTVAVHTATLVNLYGLRAYGLYIPSVWGSGIPVTLLVGSAADAPHVYTVAGAVWSVTPLDGKAVYIPLPTELRSQYIWVASGADPLSPTPQEVARNVIVEAGV